VRTLIVTREIDVQLSDICILLCNQNRHG
jgi:hypothetical protein